MTLVGHAWLRHVWFLALLVLVANAMPVSAGAPDVFYVAVTGNDDNPGTFDSPWRTIQRAASTVGAGSVVYVRGGVYNEAVTFAVSGSAEAGATRFESFPGETAIVDGTGLEVADGPSALFLIVDRSYLVVRGFELRNYASAERNIVPAGVLIRGASHHVEVSANHIHDIETRFPGAEGGDAHGIAVYGTSANESAHDIFIVGNELHGLKLGSSEAIAINGNVERFTVANNVVHDVNNIAIDCIGFEGTCPDPDVDQARDGFVINNTVYNVDSFGNPAYGEDRSAGGIYVDGGRDILVERNTVHHANIGIELASEHRGLATSGVTVRSNLVYRNHVTGISIGGYDKRRGSTENCAIINNTVVENDTLETGTGEINFQFGTRNNTIRNNIIVAGAQGKLIGNEFRKNRGNVVDSNLYWVPAGVDVTWQWRRRTYRTLDAYRAATGNDSGSILADPRLDENLRLLADSPAIDAGAAIDAGPLDIDGEPRVQGAGLDIGADEAVVAEAGRTHAKVAFTFVTCKDDPLRHRCCERCEEVAGQRISELPRHRHWQLGHVADIGGWPKKEEGTVVRAHPGEEHHARSHLEMIPVAATCFAVGASHRLTLPVDQLAADGVITVPSCR